MLKNILSQKVYLYNVFLVPEAYFLCSIDYSDSSIRVFSSLSSCKFHNIFLYKRTLNYCIFWIFSLIKYINIGYWLYLFEMVILQHQQMSKASDGVRKSSQEIITTKTLFCFIGYTWKFISCCNQEVLNYYFYENKQKSQMAYSKKLANILTL